MRNIQLLVDIRDVFAEKGLTEDDEGMPSADLVAALVAMPERSWAECTRGKALTQNALARRLKPFGIRTRDVHTGYGRRETRSFKGYALEPLKEAFARYIPGFATASPRNGNNNNGVEKNKTAQRDNGCADENLAYELKSREWRGCADKKAETGARVHVGELGADADGGPEKPGSPNWRGRT